MKITVLAGANRKKSSSTAISKYMASFMSAQGNEVAFYDLYVNPLPFYSPEGIGDDDENVARLKHAMRAADAIVLSSPEYHSGMTGLLKNALDHLDRDYFDGKAVLLVSASGGAVGVSTLQQMQTIVRNLHGIVSPEWVSIGGVLRQFDENGAPSHPDMKRRADNAVEKFLDIAARLAQVRHLAGCR